MHTQSSLAGFDRRTLLKGSGALAGGLGASAVLQALAASGARAAGRGSTGTQAPDNGGYGPLRPAPPDGELLLPAGFSYVAFGRTGSTMSDGIETPSRHDGMAAFSRGDIGDLWGELRDGRGRHGRGGDRQGRDSRDWRGGWHEWRDRWRDWDGWHEWDRDRDRFVVLIRNHEQSEGAAFAAPHYDPGAAGGTTTTLFDTRRMRVVHEQASLAGTIRNCAGGPTPMLSWLSCEETFTGLGVEHPHGYVFEVPVTGADPVEPAAIREMGRFTHEAVAVDPQTGIVYQTEDRGSAGFYRFLPDDRWNLRAGGKLQMLAIEGRERYDTRDSQAVGEPLPVEWVDIPDPDPDSDDSLAVFRQGRERGGAVFARLEGAWYGDGAVYINSTSGGDAGLGQVWEYRPRGRSGGQLVLAYESTDPELLQSPDNITVSPNSGGLVLCEDGGGQDLLRGVTTRGQIFDFAKLAGDNTSELAGATFGADGRVLFFNAQTPGVTYAVTGPWNRGAL